MRAIPFIVFCLFALMMAFMLLRKTESVDAGSTDHAPLPAITITTLDTGKPWDSSALNGRVTLINFYASWCTPCAAEMPELAAIKKQFPTLHIAGIAWNDDPKTLKPWLKKYGNPYDSLWLDAKGDATIALGIKGIPETMLIDGQGRIRYRAFGSEMQLTSIRAAVDEVLANPDTCTP